MLYLFKSDALDFNDSQRMRVVELTFEFHLAVTRLNSILYNLSHHKFTSFLPTLQPLSDCEFSPLHKGQQPSVNHFRKLSSTR